MKDLRFKWLGLLALAAGAVFSLYPSFDWYRRDAADRARQESARERPARVLNMGLDLRGGTHLVMEVETDQLPPDMPVAEAVNQAIEVIRHRVDQLGIAEPYIARQGDRSIVLQLPGIADSAQAKELVGRTALLEFRMVDDSPAAQEALRAILAQGKPFEGGKATVHAKALLPSGTALLPDRDGSAYVVGAKAEMTGASLETAHLETGERGEPVVGFRLTSEGLRFADAATGMYLRRAPARVTRRTKLVARGTVHP